MNRNKTRAFIFENKEDLSRNQHTASVIAARN